MKKIVLRMMFILVVIIGLYGTIKINEKANPVSEHKDMDIAPMVKVNASAGGGTGLLN